MCYRVMPLTSKPYLILKQHLCVFQVWILQHALHSLSYQWGGYFYDGSGTLLVPWHHGIAAPGAHGVTVMGECQLPPVCSSVYVKVDPDLTCLCATGLLYFGGLSGV